MESIDDKIKRWRKAARRCGVRATEAARNGENTDDAILDASLAAMFYAAALDAAHFGDLPEAD